jgi:hypothetical protein
LLRCAHGASLASKMPLLTLALPSNASVPSDMLRAHLQEVERIRASHPSSTLRQCGEQGAPNFETLASLGQSGACGLERIVGVQLELSRLQARYKNMTETMTLHHEYGERKRQLVAFRRMLRAEVGVIRTVCEIGFNAGHGTSIWLEGSDVEVVHSFDLLVNPYSTGSVELIKAMYPGRFFMHAGDSVKVVPRFNQEQRRANAPPCDLWYVDGWHNGKTPYYDMQHVMHSARNGTTIIADDCHRHWPSVLDGWDKMHKRGLVRHPTTFPSKYWQPAPPGHKGQSGGSGFCAGVVNAPHTHHAVLE